MKSFWFVTFICIPALLSGQNSSKVQQLEKQRKAALAEIEMTNQLLQETQATAQNSLNRLNLLSQQILSRKKVISLLNQEMSEIEGQMNETKREINQLNRDLDTKRANYGKSAQSLYKRHSSQDKLLFILSAESFTQSLRRMRYLREYADWQKRQATDIIDKQKEIAVKHCELEKTRSAKQDLLSERQKEHQMLETEETNQKIEVQQLGKKQKELQAQLTQKKRQAEALNRQIEKQIAEEIALAQAEAAKASGTQKNTSDNNNNTKREARVADTKGGYAMTREEKKLSDSFADNRGRLPYPVDGRHTIVACFGEQQHQELKYVRTSNNGIDIQTAPESDARAVFNGVVTRVFIVPGYNNSIIVRHGNYLTVYSNLSQVYVKAGDRVSTRQALGRIFADTENGNATILHFQLWKEKTKLNPQLWLEN